MERRRAPTTVRSVLDACLDRVAGEPGAATIWRVWDEAVGPQIAQRAQPIRMRGHTLLVAVSSAPWMQELQLLKRTVLSELNARLATPLIADLHFVLATTSTVVADDTRAATQEAPRCPPPPRTRDLAALPDPLRACFDGIARAWERRARS